MNRLLESDVESLLLDRKGPCVSLYFSTISSALRTLQGPIQLRKLLGQARVELRRRGLDEHAIDELLEPADELAENRHRSFWSEPDEGVALFLAPRFVRAFRVPRAFRERCVVGDRFSLKPLLPAIGSDQIFYVLALSGNEVRLLEATSQTVQRLFPEGLPHSISEALGEQKTAQYLQYHTAASSRGNARQAIYHGHGVGDEDGKAELRRYLHPVETALRKVLAGSSAPLVLAGAEPLPSLYREISNYPHIAEEGIAGNPELVRDEELRDRAWQILEPELEAPRHRAENRFVELSGSRRVSNDPAEVLTAARQGRVEALFLDCDVDLWGYVDPTGAVSVHDSRQEGDEELLDKAALYSLRNGGAVYGLGFGQVPGGSEVAAVFRY
jgi:hypothetical protein